MTLKVARPTPLDGTSLRRELADAGVTAEPVVVDSELRFGTLDESYRQTVEAVVDAHEGIPHHPAGIHLQRRYAAVNGDDSADGLTPETAKRTIAAAVRALPRKGTGGSARHHGTVHVGPGQFVESDTPIPMSANVKVSGVSADDTSVRLADGRNTALFAPEDTFTGYSHGLTFANIGLDGNRANNTTGDLIVVRRGGYGCHLRNVALANAPQAGIRVLYEAVNLDLYNVTGAGCAESWLSWETTKHANLSRIAVYGGQVDNCGEAPIRAVSHTDGGINVVALYGVKFESRDGTHLDVVRYTPAAGANGIHFLLSAVNGYRQGGGGRGLFYEEAGSGAKARVRADIVREDGYDYTFQSAKTGLSTMADAGELSAA